MTEDNRPSFIAILCICAATTGLFVMNHHPFAQNPAQADADGKTNPAPSPAVRVKHARPANSASESSEATTSPLDAPPRNIQMNTQPDAAPAWAVRFGEEFWRKPSASAQPKTTPALPLSASINLGDAMERVAHAVEMDPATGLPRVDAGTYSATFDGAGVRFSPYRIPPATETRNLRVTQAPEPDAGTEAAFRTVSVSRDGQSLYAAGGREAEWTLLGNTAQALLDPASGVIEHYEARRDGVEVTWVVPRALPGGGPLVVDAELTGLNYAGQSPEGHHFADASGTPRVRVGKVMVTDAAGHSTEIAMRADGHQLRVEVPESVLAQATYPLAIDPVLGAEFSVNTSNASISDSDPAIAFNGVNFLVVWSDARNAGSAGRDIYGTRLSLTGAILDPNGIPISVAPRDQTHPAVAAKGSDFLVAWEDYRNQASTGADIYVARVTGAGAVVQNNGIKVADETENETNPALAANATGFLLVFEQHYWSDADVIGIQIRFANNAVGIEKHDASIPWTLEDQLAPAVAACGDRFLVVWDDTRNLAATGHDIYGSLVPGFGQGDAAPAFAVCKSSGAQYTPAVAANAVDYLVVWSDYRNAGADSDIYGARVSKDGTLITSADGNPTGDFPICATSKGQFAPALAGLGSDFLVVWQDYRNGNADLCGTRVSGAGAVIDGAVMNVNIGPNHIYAPALALAPGGKAMVVSTTLRDGALRTVGNLVMPNVSAGLFQFGAANYTVSEGAAHAVISVNRVNGSAGTARVHYTTQNGTAAAGSDYTAVSGTLAFNPGQTVATFSVPIINDARDETNETVLLKLDSPTGGAALGAQSYATLTINDNDSGGVIQFGAATYSVAENATTLLLNVVRTGGVAGNVTVNYATSELPGAMHASAGLDYTHVSSSLTFDAGQTAKQIQITLKPDALHEGLEKFKVVLSSPTGGATLGLKKETIVNIIDDDP